MNKWTCPICNRQVAEVNSFANCHKVQASVCMKHYLINVIIWIIGQAYLIVHIEAIIKEKRNMKKTHYPYIEP